MPFSKAELERIFRLHSAIERGKAHENAAPTYKDRPSLMELEALSMNQRGRDPETLEELLLLLSYLADSYDKMGRAGMSVKFYTPLLSCHAALMKCKGGGAADVESLESCFYKAVRARNYYEPDGCRDLAEVVGGCLPADRAEALLLLAQQDCRRSLKHDPAEKTEAYLAAIDTVEEQIDREKTTDLCLEYWSLKTRLLYERGIFWQSPAVLNPRVLFD